MSALTCCRDDEYITEIGYLEQPAGVTPILSGYCYICRLYKREFPAGALD